MYIFLHLQRKKKLLEEIKIIYKVKRKYHQNESKRDRGEMRNV